MPPNSSSTSLPLPLLSAAPAQPAATAPPAALGPLAAAPAALASVDNANLEPVHILLPRRGSLRAEGTQPLESSDENCRERAGVREHDRGGRSDNTPASFRRGDSSRSPPPATRVERGPGHGHVRVWGVRAGGVSGRGLADDSPFSVRPPSVRPSDGRPLAVCAAAFAVWE